MPVSAGAVAAPLRLDLMQQPPRVRQEVGVVLPPELPPRLAVRRALRVPVAVRHRK